MTRKKITNDLSLNVIIPQDDQKALIGFEWSNNKSFTKIKNTLCILIPISALNNIEVGVTPWGRGMGKYVRCSHDPLTNIKHLSEINISKNA